MKIYIASAENALGSYDIDAVAGTAEKAVYLCKQAVRRERKRLGYPPFAYMDDIQAVGPLEFGSAYLDMGRAGEIA